MSQTPTEPYLAAAVQMQSGEDKRANLATATRLVEQAAAGGAQLVALPELFNCLGRYDVVAAEAEAIPGPTSDAMADLAARLHITLVAGSIAERDASGLIYNTSLLFDPDGRLLARYRKIHRFDVDLPGQVVVRESKWFAAGSDVAPVTTPLGTLGVAICYDLRFPELFRRLSSAGVQVIVLAVGVYAAHGPRSLGSVAARTRHRKSGLRDCAEPIRPAFAATHQLRAFGHRRSLGPSVGHRCRKRAKRSSPARSIWSNSRRFASNCRRLRIGATVRIALQARESERDYRFSSSVTLWKEFLTPERVPPSRKKFAENFFANFFPAKFAGSESALRRYLDRAVAISIRVRTLWSMRREKCNRQFRRSSGKKILCCKLLDKSATLGKMSQQLSVAA